MTLRNAFANLLTESVEGAVEAVLTRMDERESRRSLVDPPRDLPYARTVNDAMRVNVENGPQATSYRGNSSDTTTFRNTYTDPSAVFMVDERWQQAEVSMQTFNDVRNNRWVVT